MRHFDGEYSDIPSAKECGKVVSAKLTQNVSSLTIPNYQLICISFNSSTWAMKDRKRHVQLSSLWLFRNTRKIFIEILHVLYRAWLHGADTQTITMYLGKTSRSGIDFVSWVFTCSSFPNKTMHNHLHDGHVFCRLAFPVRASHRPG